VANKQLKLIDFSNGIKSKEIQENFNIIEEQIARERLATAGHGISKGLEITTSQFPQNDPPGATVKNLEGAKVSISEGALIDIKGFEKFFEANELKIPRPFLTKSQEIKTTSADGKINLTYIPYSTNRLYSSEVAFLNGRKEEVGIRILDYNNNSRSIDIIGIHDNVIQVDAQSNKNNNIDVIVEYYYSHKRIDVIYIDNDYKIKVSEGLTSTSPSVSMPKHYKYILGFAEIDALYPKGVNELKAHIAISNDVRSLRNIYTDDKNELYILGTPFRDLQIIHMIEPLDPKEDTLWYDGLRNKLKVWKQDANDFEKIYTYSNNKPNERRIFNTEIPYEIGRGEIDIYVNNVLLDPVEIIEGSEFTYEERKTEKYSSQFEISTPVSQLSKVRYVIHKPSGYSGWVGVNDTSFIHVQEVKMWLPETNPVDKQNFLFEDIRMNFIPGKNEVSVIIDNTPLMSDQFTEIISIDKKEEYENIGIGFRLTKPLDKSAHVEVRVTHRVNDNPIKKKFQRSATFVATDNLIYVASNGKKFNTNAPYLYDENQLEVFVDGKRLRPNIDYKEGSELLEGHRAKGVITKQFEVTSNIAEGDSVAYKITSSIYSYDHVHKIVEDLEDKILDTEARSLAAIETVNTIANSVTSEIVAINQKVEEVKLENQDHSLFIKNTDVLSEENIPASINQWIPKGLINLSIEKDSNMLLVGGEDFILANPDSIGVSPKDFITVFDISKTEGNNVLRRDVDYKVEEAVGSTNIYFNFINTLAVSDGNTLYITGIKFA
jgi:hypothetical protein